MCGLLWSPPFVILVGHTCSTYDGDCVIQATYLEEHDVTTWGAACHDGFHDGGAIGGDETAALCE
jgi:hypothetical protein